MMTDSEHEEILQRVIRRLTVQQLKEALTLVEGVFSEPLEHTDGDITSAAAHLRSAITKLEAID